MGVLGRALRGETEIAIDGARPCMLFTFIVIEGHARRKVVANGPSTGEGDASFEQQLVFNIAKIFRGMGVVLAAARTHIGLCVLFLAEGHGEVDGLAECREGLRELRRRRVGLDT